MNGDDDGDKLCVERERRRKTKRDDLNKEREEREGRV